jgi:hypothetical protein
MIDLLRKVTNRCPHNAQPEYMERRTELGPYRVHWSAFFYCPDCNALLHVEAMYMGNVSILRRAIEEEEEFDNRDNERIG